MKRPAHLFITIAGLVACSNVMAQEAAELSIEEGEYQLTIPYFEFNGEAFEVELRTPEDSDELVFVVDMGTLASVELQEAEEDISIDASEGICTATANAAYLSCKAEATEDNYIFQGNCLNKSDSLTTLICQSQSSPMQEEAEDDCGEQWEARLMLCAVIGEDPYNPVLEAGNFMSPEEIAADPNPWFPLVPGNQWIYETEDELTTVTVTEDTLEISGITSIVVSDIVTEDGEPIEETEDYYAQDVDGNVWYMGEIAKNYEDGRLADLEGSWEAGKNSAKAGILFRANPVIGETYRQEFLLGDAEDIGETLSVTASESAEEAGIVCEDNCLRVLEYTPVEPDAMEEKFYYPGIGNILTIDLVEDVREELVEYTVQE